MMQKLEAKTVGLVHTKIGHVNRVFVADIESVPTYHTENEIA